MSLDAALAAALWQILLTRDLGTHLRAGEPLVLGLCVWLVYVADRVLDVSAAAARRMGAGAEDVLLALPLDCIDGRALFARGNYSASLLHAEAIRHSMPGWR